MDQCKVFIIGNSIYSASLQCVLAKNEEVQLVGTAPNLAAAMPLLEATDAHVIFVVDPLEAEAIAALGALITRQPHLTILRTDLEHHQVQVITSQNIRARTADLTATIATLAKRGKHI